jgi:hypothetical protein
VRSRRLLIAALAVALAPAASGCAVGGTERSAEAYCDKYESGFDEIKADYPEVDQYSTSDENPLVLLLQTGSAYGDIVALIGEMAEVAPDEVQTDVERVHETLEKQLDDAGGAVSDPFGTIAGQLVEGITNAGAFERMSRYTLEHCGEVMFSASPQRER